MSPFEEFQLSTWTIFRRPADFPDSPYVVREFYIHRPGAPVPADEVILCESLEQARASISPYAVCIHRSPDDDPAIVETWI